MLRIGPKAGELTPLGRQREADADKGESNDHIPRSDARNWILSLRDVEGDDPEEADKEIGDHDRDQPRWTLERSMWLSGVNLLFVGVGFLNLLTQFRLRHGERLHAFQSNSPPRLPFE